MRIVVLADLPDVAPAQADTAVRVAARLGEVVCVLGSAPDDERTASLAAAGATSLRWADLPTDGRTSAAVAALAACAGPDDPVLIPGTRTGQEVAARLALRLARPVSAAADRVEAGAAAGLAAGELVAHSSPFGGTWRIVVAMPAAAVLTLTAAADADAPAASSAASSGSAAPDVAPLDVVLHDDPQEADVLALEPSAERGGPALTQAPIVVAGGRGTDGDFTVLEELAGLVGGAVGSSRVAVDLGWASADRQVGQTGVSVAPDVYVAAGISGAIQHLAGLGAAKYVVAVNTDPDAPIFQRCDLGIVGDLRTVLPQAVALLKEASLAGAP
jgi:electron transfer flavoprotein alpha subunit